ncbi:hypothetical protein [Methylomonas methanica]|uniref:Uncharacterized protein n=1 Tax=Methylomonas methanica (strain DSM 25384 / MC09) TaxID=857087 RepID=G0A3V7_METMM|nr:hypothetical protein [Methylomonas methanica]AEG02729.1 hypothetical protein Metme_4382 [Methylomonas methanica MC09]
MYFWGAFPATLQMFFMAPIVTDVTPWHLGQLWFAAALLGVVGLWMAVFQSSFEFRFCCAVTFIFLVAGMTAAIPVFIPLMWIILKSFVQSPDAILNLSTWLGFWIFYGPLICALHFCTKNIVVRLKPGP